MWFRGLDSEGILRKAGVPKEKTGDCLSWAFGADWPCLPLGMMNEKWNQLHGEIFLMTGFDLVIEAIDKVGKAYIKEVLNGQSKD